MGYLPLRPRWAYFLRHGLPKPKGEDARKLRRDAGLGEPPEHFERGYEHESTQKLTWHLLIEAKSQRVWTRERVLAELLDKRNVGGRWLRYQDDPEATFNEMWENAAQHAPKWSVEQMTAILLEAIEKTPGIQLVRLLSLVGGNRGHVADLLQALDDADEIDCVRTVGPGGGCTSRRFYRKGKHPVAQVAKRVATDVSLAILALSATTAVAVATTSTGKVHRSTEGSSSVPFVQALTDKKMRERGKRIWLWMAAKRWKREREQAGLAPSPRPAAQPRPRPPAEPYKPLSDEIRTTILRDIRL